MKPPSKTEAQERADQVRAFERELASLEHERVVVLTDDQRRAIRGHHQALLSTLADAFDIDRNRREKQLSLGMRIASFLGALAFAASVFFLFYQFWGKLTEPTQVLILVAAPLLTFIATMVISQRDQSEYYAKLAGLVSFACFVLNITMLGQIFNITPSDRAFIVWAVFAALLAYACEVRVLLAAGILCAIAFLSARTGTWGGTYWLHFGERPENFFPAAVVFFVIPQVIDHRRFSGFAPIYRTLALLTLLLPVLVLSNWGTVSYLNIDPEAIERIYQVVGFVLSAGAIWLGIRNDWLDAVNTGNVFFVIFLYTKFYDWWWDALPKYLFFLIVGLTALLFLVVFKRLRKTAMPGDAGA
jgi:uncharacterized membrane protein